MPKTDAHFNYFLKYAINNTKNLQEIYVIDNKDTIKENYNEIFETYEFIGRCWTELNNWENMSTIM